MGDGDQSRAFAEIILCGLHNAGMFDARNPNFALRVERAREMVHDGVVRFRRAARPDDVRRLQPMYAASFSRQSAGRAAARAPNSCIEDGLPLICSVAVSHASRASRITGAVEL